MPADYRLTALDLDALGGLLAELLRPPAWHRDAACLEHPEVTFFLDKGQSAAPALAVCAGCLAVENCKAYAVDTGQQAGVWGGTSPRGRRALRREQTAA